MPSWTHLFSETLCVTCRGWHMRQKVTRSLSTLSFIAPEFRRHFSFSFTNDYFSSLNYNNNKSNNHLLTSVDGCERTRHTNVLRSSFTVMMCCLWRVETNGHWTCRRGKRSRKKTTTTFRWMNVVDARQRMTRKKDSPLNSYSFFFDLCIHSAF